MHHITKTPRLYVEDDLNAGASIELNSDHSHYLMTVMRKSKADQVRLFNGRDGEYIGSLKPHSKKQVQLVDLNKFIDQPKKGRAVHLYVAPIKKDRMAILIEKAVELGVTDIYPIITEYTQHGKINEIRMLKQIIEAAEQCERMDIPTLHEVSKLVKTHFHAPTFAAIARVDSPFFSGEMVGDIGLLVGPEGGFSKSEIDYLFTHASIMPCSLGDRILRAETASIFMLSKIV
jgi:16S rRNA (uracil1498-N3)-methyltransferase